MSSPKRRCIEQSTEQEPTANMFLLLNDYCILKIFESLELDSLCAASRTCKKLQKLVLDVVLRKYRSKMMSEMRVEVTFDGQVILTPNAEYVRRFTKHMQNVTFGGGYQKRPLDLVTFIRNNCNDYFRTMSFEQIKLSRFHGVLIMDWLKNVESVAFFGCQNVHHVLRYCERLKYLQIGKYSNDQFNQWMLKYYPTVEYLQCDPSLSSDKLFLFLQNNPNVKSLLWGFDSYSRQVARPILELLSKKKLEEVFLTLDNFCDAAGVINEIGRLCKDKRFKRLELRFNSNLGLIDYFDRLSSLKFLEGLHILRMEYCRFPTNVSLAYLKILQMSFMYKYDPSTIVALTKNLPNLEELYLMDLSGDFTEFVTPFVRNSVKLHKIVARDFKRKDRMETSNFSLTKYFQEEREKLEGARTVTIFIGRDEFDLSPDLTMSNCLLVQIRKVVFQRKKVDFVKPYLKDFEF